MTFWRCVLASNFSWF